MTPAFSQLSEGLRLRPVGTAADPVVNSVTADSRRVRPGDVYVAVRGTAVDGHRFVDDAVQRGAVVVVVEDESTVGARRDAAFFATEDTRGVLAHLARVAQRHPDRELLLCAITGTNGKTTVAHLTRDLLEASGRRCGMLGTIRYETGARSIPAPLTTPGPEDFFALLREMRDASMVACAMEASSHALHQSRLGEAEVDVAVFTNLTREHLDYHVDLDQYTAAKLRLLGRLAGPDRRKPDGRAVVNVDDGVFGAIRWPDGSVLVGRREGCDVRVRGTRCDREGIELRIDYAGRATSLRSSLLGRYNVENLLMVAGIASALGFDAEELERIFPLLRPVPGRLEPVPLEGGPVALVDYAHTPDGLRNALVACRGLSEGRIVVVFGCGGDRDRGKRSQMAQAALAGADLAILTLDNPRTESPDRIFSDAEAGFAAEPERARRVEDRQEAIASALEWAGPDDLVLVAGKGHENYQIVGTEKLPWDDREALRRAWRDAGGRA